MKIIYQWNPWSYMHIASTEISKDLDIEIDEIIWKEDFNEAWAIIDENSIWVLPIENSYMWSIHASLYNFLQYDYKIIWEYYQDVNHCICSKEKELKNIKKAYSQLPALDQCTNYFKKHNIIPEIFSDTALSAKYVNESKETWLAAICSEKAAKIYWLNILEKNIQDQKWNTTRFAIITTQNNKTKYKRKSKKISILFEASDVPASLHKCLGAFATNHVNLTKIESLPSYSWKFHYLFWLDFEWEMKDVNIIKSLIELAFFTKTIKIIWEY